MGARILSSARIRLSFVMPLLAVPWLLTCGDDDGPTPAADSGSETDSSSIGFDARPPADSGGPSADSAAPPPPPVDLGGPEADASGDADASSATDSGPGACVNEGDSCSNGESCCDGLMCCVGTPVPPGAEFCGVTCPRSDRDLKEGFERVDVEDVLDGVRSMEITRWSYRDTPGVRHIGPMAQDFHAAFGVGETPRNIAPIDAQGAAFAAIQALARRQEQLLTENAALRARIDRLERRAGHRRARDAR